MSYFTADMARYQYEKEDENTDTKKPLKFILQKIESVCSSQSFIKIDELGCDEVIIWVLVDALEKLGYLVVDNDGSLIISWL